MERCHKIILEFLWKSSWTDIFEILFLEVYSNRLNNICNFKATNFCIPENPDKVCNEIYQKLGINSMIVDANDFNVEILGKSNNLCYNDEELKQIIKDNPAGQSNQLTPIVLIRKI